jgi:uncharacterized protein (TIGR02453 family)
MARAVPVDSSRFEGFADRDARFFRALARNQRREWFDLHRRDYEMGWLSPMKALLAEVRERLDRFFPQHPLAEPKVFRIYRDVRFSKDKSPYKTNIAASVGGEHHAGGYVSLDAKGLTAAAGRYELTPPQLKKFRSKAAAEATGRPLSEIVAKLSKQGYEIGGEELKRVPAGWPQDHPRARLLRHKRLYFWKSFGLQPWLGSAAARAKIARVWQDAEPLNVWFKRNVG